jgi:hypothetical protein
MATIPLDEKFIGLSATVDTTERRSALINAESQAYTMQDIIDTVDAGLPPSAPQMLIAVLNQSSTNAPMFSAIYADLSPNSIVRNGVGIYTLVFDVDTFLSGKVIATISLDGSSPFANAGLLGVSVGGGSNNTVFIKSYNTSGVLSDDILSGARLQVQVYE